MNDCVSYLLQWQVEVPPSVIEYVIILIVFVVLIVGFVVTIFVSKWYRRWRSRLKAALEHKLLLARLEKNWSKLLDSECVDGLSHMPEKWQSGIVPVRSETGAGLNKRLQSIAKKIIMISTRPQCCGGQRRQKYLHALKNRLNELIDEEVAPFFASRDSDLVSHGQALLNSFRQPYQNAYRTSGTQLLVRVALG